MRDLYKVLIIGGIVVSAAFLFWDSSNRAVVSNAVSVLSSSARVRYRRGSYERILTLDASDRERISRKIADYRAFKFGLLKSVGFGSVSFLDANGNDLMLVDAYKGNVVAIEGVYVELKCDFLSECGFCADEWTRGRR